MRRVVRRADPSGSQRSLTGDGVQTAPSDVRRATPPRFGLCGAARVAATTADGVGGVARRRRSVSVRGRGAPAMSSQSAWNAASSGGSTTTPSTARISSKGSRASRSSQESRTRSMATQVRPPAATRASSRPRASWVNVCSKAAPDRKRADTSLLSTRRRRRARQAS